MNKWSAMCRALVVLCVAIPHGIAHSQSKTDPDPNADKVAEAAKLTAEAAVISAKATLISARAELKAASIAALGLPQFDNKTTINEGGGAIETSMLATHAVSEAAQKIVDLANEKTVGKKVVVLTGDESFDPNSAVNVKSRMSYIDAVFEEAAKICGRGNGPVGTASIFSAAAISAVAGLIGNEVEVSAVALSKTNDAMLAYSIAGNAKLTGRAILPSASLGIADIEGSEITTQLAALLSKHTNILRCRAEVPHRQGVNSKADAAQLDDALAQFKEFLAAINTSDSATMTPYVNAVVVDRFAKDWPMILRVAINEAGGTLTNTKNIASFFGKDPVRVSGGLVARYALVDSKSGIVQSAGAITCRTVRTRLKHIQSGDWKTSESKKAVCD